MLPKRIGNKCKYFDFYQFRNNLLLPISGPFCVNMEVCLVICLYKFVLAVYFGLQPTVHIELSTLW